MSVFLFKSPSLISLYGYLSVMISLTSYMQISIRTTLNVKYYIKYCVNKNGTYSRTPMVRTLMARLARLFRTRALVPRNKYHSCRFGIIKGDFPFYIENGILCVLIRIASVRRF